MKHLILFLIRKLFSFTISPPKGMYRLSKIVKRLIFYDKYYLVPLNTFDIYVCPSHTIGMQIIKDNFYEREISEIISNSINNGFSFIDIGANIGYHTLLAASAMMKSNKEKHIFSIEPHIDFFKILKKNCKRNSFNNIICINKAFAEKPSSDYLNISSTRNKGRTSFLPIPNSKKSGTKVNIDTLDSFFCKRKEYYNEFFIIKIDVEGYEYHILKGGIEWLNSIPHIAIVIEIWPDLIKNSKWSEEDIYDLLIEAGFNRFFRIIDKAYGFNDNHLILKNLDNFNGLDSKVLIEYSPERKPI